MRNHQRDETVFPALTLLVAVCEQVSLELQEFESPPLPLLNRLQETHDLAIDLARSLTEPALARSVLSS